MSVDRYREQCAAIRRSKKFTRYGNFYVVNGFILLPNNAWMDYTDFVAGVIGSSVDSNDEEVGKVSEDEDRVYQFYSKVALVEMGLEKRAEIERVVKRLSELSDDLSKIASEIGQKLSQEEQQ